MSWAGYQNRSTSFGTIQPSQTRSTVPAIASSCVANPVKTISGPIKIPSGIATMPVMSPSLISPRAMSPQGMSFRSPSSSVLAPATKARTVAPAATTSPPATTRATRASSPAATFSMTTKSAAPGISSPRSRALPSTTKARAVASSVSLPTAGAMSPRTTSVAASRISPPCSVAAPPATKAWTINPSSAAFSTGGTTSPRAMSPARTINPSSVSFSTSVTTSPRATSPSRIINPSSVSFSTAAPTSPRAMSPARSPRSLSSWAPACSVTSSVAPKARTMASSVSFSAPAPFSTLVTAAGVRSAVPQVSRSAAPEIPTYSHRSAAPLPTVSAPQFIKPVIKESGSYSTLALRKPPTTASLVAGTPQNLTSSCNIVSERIMTTGELVAHGRIAEASAKPVVTVVEPDAIAEPDAETDKVPENRGSEGRGLPSEMSEQTVATIKATAAVVAPKALDITQHFYNKIFTKMPELFSFFNKANQGGGVQPKALAAAVVAYASNIDNLGPLVVPKGPVEGICHKHCGLNILPAHYVVVHANLMETIGEVLGDVVTPDIAAGWSEAVLFLAKVMIDWEERLYSEAESRAGGWRGMKDMVVNNIEQVTPDVKRFTFQDPAYDGPYDFSPGQFLTIKVDPNGDGLIAPRHYTVTSAPGEPFLQCSVKRVPDGVVSNYLHDVLNIGDTVKLSPPYGIFTPSTEDEKAVLISAGIGVTPMLNYCQHFGKGVQMLVHVDKSPESHPYVDYFNSLGCKTLFHYTSTNGRPLADDLANTIIKDVGTSPAFYLCGPPSFMSSMVSALKGLGASNVNFEAFVPQLGCPIAH